MVQYEARGELLAGRKQGILQLDLAALRGQITPSHYGRILGEFLFRDQIRDAFTRALAQSSDKLHLLLFIEDNELRSLHWEWLCAPLDGDWKLLALAQQVPWAFYLPSSSNHVFPAIRREDLRTLVVVANPKGLEQYKLPSFDAQTTLRSVTQALGDIPYTTLDTTPDAELPPTLDHLSEALTTIAYPILHIVAHGTVSRKTGETALFLAGTDQQVAVVMASQLIERLSAIRYRPYLIFLSTCESASPEAEQSLGGLGQRLVRELGIPAVVAMTDKVSIATAQRLAEQFYRRLTAHGEVDVALVEACIGLAKHDDVTVPALYSRLRGQALFGINLKTTKQEAEMADQLDKSERITLGDNAQVQGDVVTGGKRVINTGGGAYIEGGVSTGGGDFVGRNKITQTGADAEGIAKAFGELYQALEQKPDTMQKNMTKQALETLEEEAQKGNQADEEKVKQGLEVVMSMLPDIGEVAINTFINPVYGLSTAFKKIAQKAKESR